MWWAPAAAASSTAPAARELNSLHTPGGRQMTIVLRREQTGDTFQGGVETGGGKRELSFCGAVGVVGVASTSLVRFSKACCNL